jgi:uncharacterized protein YbbK (DUF523 family)
MLNVEVMKRSIIQHSKFNIQLFLCVSAALKRIFRVYKLYYINMERRIKIGISSCLLGEKMRYDGGHKLDSFLIGALGPLAEWLPVCPEVESGLPVPREAMRLEGDFDEPRLVTIHTGIDHTERMVTWSQRKVIFLQRQDLCGFIFKSKSPSCGLRDLDVCTPSGAHADIGNPERQDFGVRGDAGIFARIVMNAFPLSPIEDDESLHDPAVMANFIKKIFDYADRIKEMPPSHLLKPKR